MAEKRERIISYATKGMLMRHVRLTATIHAGDDNDTHRLRLRAILIGHPLFGF